MFVQSNGVADAHKMPQRVSPGVTETTKPRADCFSSPLRHSGCSDQAYPQFSCHAECGEGSFEIFFKFFLLLVVKSCRKEGEMVPSTTH